MQKRSRARFLRRMLAVVLSAAIAAGLAMPAAAAAGGDGRVYLEVSEVSGDRITADRYARGMTASNRADAAASRVDPDRMVRVSIVLEKESTIAAGYSTMNIAANRSAMSYRNRLRMEQAAVQQAVERKLGRELDVVWNLTLAANIISANVRCGDIGAIEAVSGVKSVYIERQYLPDVVTSGGTLEPNMAISGGMNGNATAWDAGYYGEGTLVAVVDSGTDVEHQSFDEGAFLHALEEDGNVELKLTRAAIEAHKNELNAYREYYEKYESAPENGFYVSDKIPFGYNYVDADLDLSHDDVGEDGAAEHGGHVAGTATANRYIPDGNGGYVDALETVFVAGNAPDAQLMVMKVFGERGGAFDSDVIAATEDAIILGADAINLSLGVSVPGFASPVAQDDPYYDILDTIAESDTVVIYSAGNSGSWAEQTYFGVLYNDGVQYQYGGEAGSYTNSFTVASVENDGMIGPYLEVNGLKVNFDEPNSTNRPITTLETEDGNTYEFVFLNSYGATVDEYADAGVDGKIAIVWRGNKIDFSNKHRNAQMAGALAVIVANNVPGGISMQLGKAEIPAVSISLSDGQQIWESAGGGELTIGAGGTVTGEISVNSEVIVNSKNAGYYTMSDFSSWGTTGDLALKPEITAPGGNIWSVFGRVIEDGKVINGGTDQYELMSGTSMAAPQIAGLAAVVQQYLRDEEGHAEKGITIPADISPRAMTMGLLMAAAKPMKDENGNYYSLLQQGSGLANVGAAVTSPVYITVDGRDDGKVKAELGDDFNRDGVYTVRFTIHNMSDAPYECDLSASAFTQAYFEEDGEEFLDYSTRYLDAAVEFSVGGAQAGTPEDLKYDFNGDGAVDSADAQILLDWIIQGTRELDPAAMDVNGDGVVNTYDVHKLLNYSVRIEPQADVEITATITLSDNEKATLEEQNPGGAFVEAYVFVQPAANEEGAIEAPQLSIPVLAYYGSWTDSPMFEYGTGADWLNSYLEGEWTGERLPYTYGYLWEDDEGVLDSKDVRNAFYYWNNSTNALLVNGAYYAFDGSLTGLDTDLTGYIYTLIRNAGGSTVRITADVDGEDVLLWSSGDLGREYAIFKPGSWVRIDNNNQGFFTLFNSADIRQNVGELLESKNALDAGSITISLIKAPEYYAGEDGTYDWDELTDGIATADNKELGPGAYLSTTLIVDAQPPEITMQGANAPSWYYVDDVTGEKADGPREGAHPVIRLEVSDDNSVVDVALYNADGDVLYQELSPEIVDRSTRRPVFKATEPGEKTVVTFDGVHTYDLTYYGLLGMILDNGKQEDLEPQYYLIAVTDSAGNERVYELRPAEVEPTEIAESVVILEGDKLTLILTREYQLNVRVYPTNLTDRTVQWSSDDTSIVTVDENGVISAVGLGTATVTATATAGGADGRPVSAEIEIEVVEVDVTFNALVRKNDETVWAEVRTPELPGYEELGAAGHDLTSAAVDFAEGALYAAETGSDGVSILYKVDPDPDSLEAVSLGPVVIPDGKGGKLPLPITDMADALGVPYESGGTFVAAASGTGVYLIAPNNSGATAIGPLWENERGGDIVGVAWAGILSYDGIPVDVYYAIDENGNVFRLAFLYMAYDGEVYSLGFEDTDDDGYLFSTGITVDPGHLGDDSLYFVSGDKGYELGYIIWSHYDSDDECVKILAIDEGTQYIYRTRAFDREVAVGGLVTIDDANNVLGFLPFSAPYAVDGAHPVAELAAAGETSGFITGGTDRVEVSTGGASGTAGVTVNAGERTVTVPVYASGSTNGKFTVSYDPNVLTLGSHSEGGMLTSVKSGSDTVLVGYAGGAELNEKVTELVFTYASSSSRRETSLTLGVLEDGGTVYPAGEELEVYTAILPGSQTGTGTGGGTGAPSAPSEPSEDTGVSTGSAGGNITETTARPAVSTGADGESASASVSDSMGAEIVRQAEANDSDSVVIKPDMSNGVTSAEVTLPGETLAELGEKTGANVTVKTPVGSVTIPNGALEQLGSAGGSVTVSVAANDDDTISVNIKAGGQNVGTVSGGLKAAVPVGDGQVAVLVDANGTQTIIRKSMVEGGTAYVMLDGSATLKIVDNGKAYDDVSGDKWYSDAVSFASSHELFKGTSDSTFAPDAKMTRAMLVTVLWRLEGEAKAGAGAVSFADTDSSAWYAEGMAWASAAGIVNGTGGNSFSPNDSITREQLAAVLYRYAGTVGLDTGRRTGLSGFADGAGVSGYARDAMEWAVAVGLIKGTNNGLEAGAPASRAEVAAILQRLVSLMVK